MILMRVVGVNQDSKVVGQNKQLKDAKMLHKVGNWVMGGFHYLQPFDPVLTYKYIF